MIDLKYLTPHHHLKLKVLPSSLFLKFFSHIEHNLFYSIWLEQISIAEANRLIEPEFDKIIEENQESRKPINLLGDQKMVKERLELDSLIGSQLGDLGL